MMALVVFNLFMFVFIGVVMFFLYTEYNTCFPPEEEEKQPDVAPPPRPASPPEYNLDIPIETFIDSIRTSELDRLILITQLRNADYSDAVAKTSEYIKSQIDRNIALKNMEKN